uniref:Uncharacterized protein n=1 Tax=Globodera rostochiensis TaxID=31243 RepID=A0A914H7T3_GLORO
MIPSLQFPLIGQDKLAYHVESRDGKIFLRNYVHEKKPRMQTPIGLCPPKTMPMPPALPERAMPCHAGHAVKQAKNEWQVLGRKTPSKERGKCREKTSVVLPQPKPQLQTIWQTLTVRRQPIKKPIPAAVPTTTEKVVALRQLSTYAWYR